MVDRKEWALWFAQIYVGYLARDKKTADAKMRSFCCRIVDDGRIDVSSLQV